MAERCRVEQRHVGALPELRAGRMRGVADDRQPPSGRQLHRVVAVARQRQLVETVDLAGECLALRPQRDQPRLPGVDARGPHLFDVGRLQAPEERRHLFGARLRPADRQHADHDAGLVVALQQRMLVETLVAPAERRPERAIGERPRLGRVVEAPAQLRARAAGVDDKVERPCPAATASKTRLARSPTVQRLDLDAGLDGDALALHGAVQHTEQRRPMHRQPEAAAALRIVADVEHGAAAARIGAMQTLDAAAQRQDVVEQAEIVEHASARSAAGSAPSRRPRVLEALEDGDAVPGALEIERRGQPRRPGAGNRDVERNSHCPPNQWPDNPSATLPNQGSRRVAENV